MTADGAPPVTPLDTALKHVREARQFLGERNRYRKALEAIAECRAGMPYPVLARQALESGPRDDSDAGPLAAIREVIARYRDGNVSPVGAFGDIVRLMEGSPHVPDDGEYPGTEEIAEFARDAGELGRPEGGGDGD